MVTPSSSSQYTQQFLSSVLSQSGNAALPYTEDSKWLIRQHLLSLSETFPALHPQTTSYTHNDGRTVHLLQSYGTIPMLFQNVTYNIPVIIWLMESYPRHPPLVRVNPTNDMIIKRPHPFVNPDGMVSIPYLHNWVYPSSNLVDLARNLSHYFGRDPPLYSQRRPPPVTPSTLTPPPPSDSFSNASTRPAIPPGTYPASPYGSNSNRVSEDAGEVFRRNAINKLVESLSGDVGAMRKSKEGEMEGLFAVQGVLRQRAEVVGNGLREMQGEKEGLEMQLQMVVMNSDVLSGWLRENEGKGKRVGGVDEAFEAVDGLSKQMLECTAADLAVEDVVYALDKAAQDGAIPFDQYLRSVRSLAREQFFHRATGFKVRGAQMQAQVSSMAARASHYPS